jgi:protein pelota
MIILKRQENDVKVKAQGPEDLWHLEKVISIGDLVSASTTRKYKPEGGSKAERKPMFITVKVEKVSFHKPSGKLRILGVIESGKPEELVSFGAHHSLDVGTNDVLTITKEQWKKYELGRLREAAAASKQPKLTLLIMDETEAEIFTLLQYGLEEAGKIVSHISGKYTDEQKDPRVKYYTKILDTIKNIKHKIILAGPGFEKDNFIKFIKDKDPKFAKNILIESIGNTGKQAAYELVSKGTIDKIVQRSRFAEETKLIEDLVVKISGKGKATYGLSEVKKALDYKAVDNLILLDTLIFEKKQEIEPLIEQAEKIGATVTFISHENEISKKLEALGGIAALLRFETS